MQVRQQFLLLLIHLLVKSLHCEYLGIILALGLACSSLPHIHKHAHMHAQSHTFTRTHIRIHFSIDSHNILYTINDCYDYRLANTRRHLTTLAMQWPMTRRTWRLYWPWAVWCSNMVTLMLLLPSTESQLMRRQKVPLSGITLECASLARRNMSQYVYVYLSSILCTASI